MQVRFSNAILSVIASLCVIVFLVIVLLGFRGDVYTTVGNIHDFFLPINSAYALKNNLILHEEFHSPFGVIYHFMNFYSLRMIEYYDYLLEIPDIVYLTNIQFSLFIFILFLIVRRDHDTSKVIPFWILIILIPIIFQTRDIGSFESKYPYWYASYNNHLWALFILQSIVVYRGLRENASLNEVLVAAFYQSLFLFVAFNYKISFSIASAILCFSMLFAIPKKYVVAYAAIGILSFSIMSLLLAVVGYSYSGYVQDIWVTASGKSSGLQLRFKDIFPAILFFVGLRLARFNRFPLKLDVQLIKHCAIVKEISFDSLRIVFGLICRQLMDRTIWVDGLISLAILVGILGDYFKPTIIFLLIGLVYLFFIFDVRKIVRNFSVVPILILSAGVAYFVTLNFQAAWVLAINKHVPVVEAQNGSLPRWQVVEIGYDPNPIKFRIRRAVSVSEFMDGLPIRKSNEWEQALLRTSYITTSVEHKSDLFWWFNGNRQYVEELNNLLTWFNEVSENTMQDQIVTNLGFINPWPFLTGGKMQIDSLHWMHLGTTIAPENIGSYLDRVLESDVVIMPAFTIDAKKQTFANCSFLERNADLNYPFDIVAIVGTSIVLSKAGKMPDEASVSVKEIDEVELRKTCSDLSKKI